MIQDLAPQEVFNRTAEHLLNQGCKAVIQSQCRYRGHRGVRCAVGYWIPDDEYDSGIEGAILTDPTSLTYQTINREMEPKARRLWEILDNVLDLKVHGKLLMDLQTAHDMADYTDFRSSVKKELRRIAKMHKLDPAILERKY